MATTTALRASPATRSSRTGLIVVALLSLAIALVSLQRYAQGSVTEIAAAGGDGAAIAQAFTNAPAAVQVALYVHIAGGAVALLAGPSQFSRRLRNRARTLHRALGRVYFGAVALAALAALVIAPWNSAGLVGVLGFGSLGVLWLWTGALALRAIRRRDVEVHQAWMIRNYALTFAAPTLRLWLVLLITAQVASSGGVLDPELAFSRAYVVVPFLCWVPNLVVAEWLIRRRGLPALGRRWGAAARHPTDVVARSS